MVCFKAGFEYVLECCLNFFLLVCFVLGDFFGAFCEQSVFN